MHSLFVVVVFFFVKFTKNVKLLLLAELQKYNLQPKVTHLSMFKARGDGNLEQM